MQAITEIRGVHADYNGRPLFSGLELSLASNRFNCLLGRSGVGKSTLLRIFCGLATDDPTALNLRADSALPAAGGAAWMGQQDSLLPWASALDNVLLGPRLRGPVNQALRRRARQLLARVGLEGCEHCHPQQLSGGQRQRVALVRTLLEAPAVVAMDEPFAAVDAITRLSLQELAMELLQSTTVLLATHDPLEAARCGQRIFILRGRPAQLVKIEPALGPHPVAADDSRRLAPVQRQLLEALQQAS